MACRTIATPAPMNEPGFLPSRREDSFPHPVYSSIAQPVILSSSAGRRKQASGSFRDNDGDRRHLAQVPAGAVPARGSDLAIEPRSASDETCPWPRRQSRKAIGDGLSDTDASLGRNNNSLCYLETSGREQIVPSRLLDRDERQGQPGLWSGRIADVGGSGLTVADGLGRDVGTRSVAAVRPRTRDLVRVSVRTMKAVHDGRWQRREVESAVYRPSHLELRRPGGVTTASRVCLRRCPWQDNHQHACPIQPYAFAAASS